MSQNNIGEFIQQSRKAKGFTQKDLGDRIGVSDKTISKWENGVSPTKRILETIHETPACVKGITIEYYIFLTCISILICMFLISKRKFKINTI